MSRFIFVLTILFFSSSLFSIEDLENYKSKYLLNDTTKNDTTAIKQIVTTGATKNLKNIDFKKKYDGNWGGLIVRTIFAIIIVIIVIFLLLNLFKFLQSKKKYNGNLPIELYKVIGTAPLTHNKMFMVVKFFDIVYLLVVSDTTVIKITEIDDPEKIVDIESIIPDGDVLRNSKFAKILGKKLKSFKK